VGKKRVKAVSVVDVLGQAKKVARLASSWPVYDTLRHGEIHDGRDSVVAGKCKLAPRLKNAARELQELLRAPVSVTVLRIEHKHGADVYLFGSEAAAFAQVAAFVSEWWAQGVGARGRMPKDPKKAVAEYFAVMEGEESYSIGFETLVLRSPIGKSKAVNVGKTGGRS